MLEATLIELLFLNTPYNGAIKFASIKNME